MALKLPWCKRFPRRIPEEDLQQMTTEEMNQKGALNYYQAVLYQETSQEVIGSTYPQFSTLQSHPKQREEKSWIQAYEFVYDFLQKHNMNNTLKTIETEFRQTGKPIFFQTIENFRRDEYFKELENVSVNLGQRTFKTRVDQFCNSEGLS